MSLENVLEVAMESHSGMVRPHNEDSVHADPASGVVILADGMGGYNAGEVASGMATTLLGSMLEEAFAEQPAYAEADGRRYAAVALEREIAITNQSIYNAAQSQPQYAGMGTTLVAAVFHDNAMTVAHIGDSRMYRFRNGVFSQVTKDHSLLQEQIDSGMITPEQARHSQNRNLVTRALGVDPSRLPAHIERGPAHVCTGTAIRDADAGSTALQAWRKRAVARPMPMAWSGMALALVEARARRGAAGHRQHPGPEVGIGG